MNFFQSFYCNLLCLENTILNAMEVLVIDMEKFESGVGTLDERSIRLGNQMFEVIQSMPGLKHAFLYVKSVDEDVHLHILDLLRNSRNPILNAVSIYAVFQNAVTKVCGHNTHPRLSHIKATDARSLYNAVLHENPDSVFLVK